MKINKSNLIGYFIMALNVAYAGTIFFVASVFCGHVYSYAQCVVMANVIMGLTLIKKEDDDILEMAKQRLYVLTALLATVTTTIFLSNLFF